MILPRGLVLTESFSQGGNVDKGIISLYFILFYLLLYREFVKNL